MELWSHLGVWSHLCLLALSQTAAAGPPSGLPVARVAQLSADFGLRLFREVSKASKEQNLVFSPHGAASVVAMLQVASEGTTRRQIQEALGFSLKERGIPGALWLLQKTLGDPQGKDAVRVAEALFVQRDLPLVPTFLRRFRRLFHQTVKQVDFAESSRARGIVNAWVEQHTNGMIQGFLPEGALDALTRLVLVNAIHFKGLWQLPFPEAATRQRIFHKLGGSTVAVPMMEQTAEFHYGEFSTPGLGEYDVIELPYQGATLSMLIASPFQLDAPLSALAAAIDPALLAEWKGNMSAVTRLLVLPKFSLESEVDLRGPLEALGVTDMFDCHKANFSLRDALFVSRALQKVKIDVNESGTEASSATAAIVYARMAPLEIVLDRPFLFVVRHNPTGARPLLCGPWGGGRAGRAPPLPGSGAGRPGGGGGGGGSR
uniref:Plasminogen activator inhibitor 1 n=1 Tax=Pseudonaja textilis TaxID=8673 RepID=A0A670ZKE6_PSETE